MKKLTFKKKDGASGSRIKIKLNDYVEMTVRITDEMRKDYQECRRMAEEIGDCKDCNTCSVRKADLDEFDTGLCEIQAIEDIMNEQEERKH